MLSRSQHVGGLFTFLFVQTGYCKVTLSLLTASAMVNLAYVPPPLGNELSWLSAIYVP